MFNSTFFCSNIVNVSLLASFNVINNDSHSLILKQKVYLFIGNWISTTNILLFLDMIIHLVDTIFVMLQYVHVHLLIVFLIFVLFDVVYDFHLYIHQYHFQVFRSKVEKIKIRLVLNLNFLIINSTHTFLLIFVTFLSKSSRSFTVSSNVRFRRSISVSDSAKLCASLL